MKSQWLSILTAAGVSFSALGATTHSLSNESVTFYPLADSPYASTVVSGSNAVQSLSGAVPYIVGGTDADADTYNFHARLVEVSEDGYWYGDICGASIINDSFILTAAHCVEDYSNGETLIDETNGGIIVKNFSSYDVYSEEIKAIKSVHVHSLFRTDSFYIGDIAIIELAVPIADNVRSMPIADMSNKTEYDALTDGIIIGMGYTDDNQSSPETLQVNTTMLRNHAQCEITLGSSINYDEVICTQFGGRTCQGDSGGSLLYTTGDGDVQQIGVTSYGYFACEDEDQYSVFTEVAYYKDWIDSIVTHGNELTFDPDGEHNGYHSYGDNNYIYGEFECFGCTSSEATSSGGSFGWFSLLAVIGVCVRNRKR